MKTSISEQPFGTAEGKPVHLFSITNKNGCVLGLSNFGASIISFTSPAGYDCIVGDKSLRFFAQRGTPYFGATVGRLAGRTAPRAFTAGGATVTLAPNEGTTAHLHGGIDAMSHRVWRVLGAYEDEQKAGVRFEIESPDGDNGYPGSLTVLADIALGKEENTIYIDYRAQSSVRTPVNLTNHAYFRLEGKSILEHTLAIFSDEVYEYDAHAIPTGATIAVAGTPWDLRKPVRIAEPVAQLKEARQGIDHIWKLRGKTSGAQPAEKSGEKVLIPVATLTAPSGASLQTHSTCPALVCYTGNFLGTYTAGERAYESYEAVCFETQYASGFLHAPNMPQSFADPAAPWHERTEYRFLF